MAEQFDLEASRALCDAASPGPWEVHPDSRPGISAPAGTGYFREGHLLSMDKYGPAWDDGPVDNHADAFFIACARTLLPAALAEIERLRAEVESLKRTAAGLQ